MEKEEQLFKALADKTRLRILWLLMEEKKLCVADVMGVLAITQSSASRHLRYLFNAGLVKDRREGIYVYYRISVAPGSREDKQLQLLREMLSGLPETGALRQRLQRWLG